MGEQEEQTIGCRTLVEQLPAAVYVYASDEAKPAVYMSPRVEDMLGYTPDEWLAGLDFWEKLLHSKDRERAVAEVACAREIGKPLRGSANRQVAYVSRNDGKAVESL